MMVPVGRLTVMKIVPRDQYMAAMTFVTLPGQVGPLLGPALGGVLVEYASWHWIFLINIPVGIVGAIATLCLMPNYTMQTRRFDLSGFLLLAAGMATLTPALDGQKGLGISLPGWRGWRPSASRPAVSSGGTPAATPGRCLALTCFATAPSLGLGGSFAGTHRQRHAAVYDPGVSADRPRLLPFHAGLMMIPMVLGSMGMKADRGPVWSTALATVGCWSPAPLGLAAVSLLFMFSALAGWYYVLPLVLFLQGMINASRFSSMNTLTLKDLPDDLASSGNSLLSMVMQLSMSIGVTIAGLLLGLYGQQHMSLDASSTHQVFLYTYLSMAAIIALPALIFSRVPDDVGSNIVLRRRNRSGS